MDDEWSEAAEHLTLEGILFLKGLRQALTVKVLGKLIDRHREVDPAKTENTRKDRISSFIFLLALSRRPVQRG